MDIQNNIDCLYAEIEELQQEITEGNFMTPDQEEQLELLITKSIKFGELCAQGDAKSQAVPEGFVLLPVAPTQAIKTALSYQCFDFINVAQIYRNLGFDIPKKAEDEQSFFLFKFLILAIKHGEDFIRVFNDETKALVEAQEQSHD
ncbi:hypothetical protein [Acinetobacter sp. NigerLNRRAM0016]